MKTNRSISKAFTKADTSDKPRMNIAFIKNKLYEPARKSLLEKPPKKPDLMDKKFKFYRERFEFLLNQRQRLQKEQEAKVEEIEEQMKTEANFEDEELYGFKN
jgi:uncharacterized membrane-anchored protein YjiN (DUF445 family)